MASLCNLDGAILPEEEARIPVLDRGFLFGDSIYEVIRTVGGVPFAWPEHLQRLRASARGIALELDLDDAAIMGRVLATMERAANPESYVRIIVSRGTGTAPNIDLAHAPGPPCWVILVRPLPQLKGQPVHLRLIERRRNDPRALDPAVKSGNYLNNILGLAEARAQGATDCVFLNPGGMVCEASTSNVFAVRGGVVLTPPLHAGILAGVTRGLLLEFCGTAGIPAEQLDLTPEEFRTADELFVSSTLKDVAAVTMLDGKPVGDGQSGPVTRKLASGFATHVTGPLAERYQRALQALRQQ